MRTTNEVYINALGVFLPGEPICNEHIEDYLGKINGKDSRAKTRVLKQNGIKNRHYAIDKNQNTKYLNADMAAIAIKNAISKSVIDANQIQLLATGTTQGDLPIPGFGSMVHAQLDIPQCEVASFQSVCASGIMAINDAYTKIKVGDKNNAVCTASEFASRLFKSSRYEAQGMKSLPFDAEFLRWMLSDGAGAAILEDKPHPNKTSLRIDWIDIKSHANDYPLCMYTGKNDNKNEGEQTWLDYPNYESASQAGAINLKQDIRLLDQVVKVGVAHFFELVDNSKIDAEAIDWLVCHYSSEMFKQPIKDLLQKGGAVIEDEKWFSNLATKGNTGSASIYIMLEELLYSGKLKVGDSIICMVPESGRFITSFMKLTVVGNENATNVGNGSFTKKYKARPIASPELIIDKNPTSEWLIRQLTQVWVNFETELLKVPIVQKIHDGRLTLEDYKLLLMDLRQQVIDGSQWISRGASNIDIELFELRSAFIKHTAAEHKDYQILEKNYVALGEELSTIQSGIQNIGSVALTSFMFQQASKPNPVDLLGSMFIIEGIGKRLASYWGEMMKDQLGLTKDQVSFFTYHGVADENHFHNLEKALNHPMMNMDIAKRIARTAKITGKLYCMQLRELGNY